MRPRTVLVLALVAALLGAYLLFDRRAATTDEAAAKRQRLLPTLQVDAVQTLRIEGQGRSAVQLERVAAGGGGPAAWRLKSAPGGPVDAAVLRKLLSTIEFLEWTRELPGGRNPRQLGLAPPQLAITLGRARGAAWRLELGSVDPSGTGLYARAGKKIVVVESSTLTALDLGPQSLRDRDLMPFSAADVQRLSLRQPAAQAATQPASQPLPATHATHVELARGKDGSWRLMPQGLWVQTSEADRLVGVAAGLRARRFLAKAGAPGPGARLIVEAKGEEKRELRILAACAGRPAERHVALLQGKSWLHCCVAKEDLAPLLAARPAALTDKALTRLVAADLSKISILRGKDSLTLERRGTRWLYALKRGADAKTVGAKTVGAKKGGAKADEGEADADVIRAWVGALAQSKGKVDATAAAVVKAKALVPEAELTLQREGGGSWLLRFGTVGAAGLPVRRGDEPALLWVAPSVLELLSVDAQRWRERTVLRLPRYEIARLAWQRPGASGTPATLERAERHDDGWRLVEPPGVPIDAAVLRQLLDRLAALRAERYLDLAKPRAPGARGLATKLKVTLETQRVGSRKQVRVIELRLDGLADGRCRGELGEKPPFELKASDCAALTAQLAERQLLRFRRAELKELVLRRAAGKSHRLRKGVDGWAAEGRRPAAAAISALLNALSSLEAERVLGYGAAKIAAAEPGGLEVELVGTSTRLRLRVDKAGTAAVLGRKVRYQLGKTALEALRNALAAVLGQT